MCTDFTMRIDMYRFATAHTVKMYMYECLAPSSRSRIVDPSLPATCDLW